MTEDHRLSIKNYSGR